MTTTQQMPVSETVVTSQSICLDTEKFRGIEPLSAGKTAYVCVTYQPDKKRLIVNTHNLHRDHARDLIHRAAVAMGSTKFARLYQAPELPAVESDAVCAVFMHPGSGTITSLFKNVEQDGAIDLLRFGRNNLEATNV